MTAAQILTAARAHIVTGWTTIQHAVDSNDRAVNPLSTQAVAFTIIGAIVKAAGGKMTVAETQRAQMLLLDQIEEDIEILDYNNAPGRTKAEVLALIDAAIASA